MDGSQAQPPSPPHEAAAGIGSDAELIAVDAGHPADLTEPLGNMAVYCGSEERIGQGFVIALRAMGIDADLPEGDTAPCRPDNREH